MVRKFSNLNRKTIEKSHFERNRRREDESKEEGKKESDIPLGDREMRYRSESLYMPLSKPNLNTQRKETTRGRFVLLNGGSYL